MARRFVPVMVAVISSLLVMGCEAVRPEARGKLAHPTMSTEDMTTPIDGHVRAVSEGASGGLGGAGGGCGCN